MPAASASRAGDGTGSSDWKIPGITGGLGIVCLLIVSYGFYTGNRINTVDAKLVQAVTTVKLEAITADILLEALMDGGVVAGIETVWHPVEGAMQDFGQLVEHGLRTAKWQPFIGIPVGLTDLQLFQTRLATVKAGAIRCMLVPQHGLIEDPAVMRYRSEFRQFLTLADQLQSSLRHSMAADLERFKYSQSFLIVLCAILTLAAFFTLRRIDRRRTAAYRELQAAKNRLMLEVKRSDQLLKELKDYSYAISHDLRAPLISIKGFSREIRLAVEALRKPLAVPLTGPPAGEIKTILEKELPEAVEFIDSAATRMNQLLAAMLKLSRLGRRKLDPEPVDPNLIVADALKIQAYSIKARNISVICRNLPGVVADKEALEQIFTNLLSNAVNYLHQDRPGCIEISGEELEDETTYRVKDNGRGMQSGDTEKIFNMFERLGQNDVAGEGMGLCYVRTLVRRHGGWIICESQPGTGSTFTFAIAKHLPPDDHKKPVQTSADQWRRLEE